MQWCIAATLGITESVAQGAGGYDHEAMFRSAFDEGVPEGIGTAELALYQHADIIEGFVAMLECGDGTLFTGVAFPERRLPFRFGRVELGRRIDHCQCVFSVQVLVGAAADKGGRQETKQGSTGAVIHGCFRFYRIEGAGRNWPARTSLGVCATEEGVSSVRLSDPNEKSAAYQRKWHDPRVTRREADNRAKGPLEPVHSLYATAPEFILSSDRDFGCAV